MKIKRIMVGDLQANCYLLIKNGKVIIIDPGDEKGKIEQEIGNNKVVGILVTHHHFDHIGELSYFENKYGLQANEKIENFSFEIIETPGHSKDSLTFYFKKENMMFTGDFLFKGTIGRMDLEGGSVEDMQKSLQKIFCYPRNTMIYPGHGESSFLGTGKANITIKIPFHMSIYKVSIPFFSVLF